MKKNNKLDAARELVVSSAVPLWLELAPEVRAAVLDFQRIVATRNDLGTLASMHNKFVRLSLFRLRLSLQEYAGELLPMEKAFSVTMRPDEQASDRLIVPTRPGLLGRGEQLRIRMIATGSKPVGRAALHVRSRWPPQWVVVRAELAGRCTYEASLSSFGTEPLEYYASADLGGETVVSPPDAPRNTYRVTILPK